MSRPFAALLRHGGRRLPATGSRRFRIPLVGALVLALSVPAALTPVAMAQDPLGRPDAPKPRVSQVKNVNASDAARDRLAKKRAANSKQTSSASGRSWPKASKGTQDIATPAKAKTISITALAPGKRNQVAKGPKTPPAAGTATVNLLDQKTAREAGVTGIVFAAAAQTPGVAQVTVDYQSFASAVGGNWADRLGLVTLPACVLTTPQKPECRKQTVVSSQNDVSAQTVAAQVNLSEARAKAPAADASGTVVKSMAAPVSVFALTATAGSPSARGDYAATPLAASSSWEAGGSSGSFTWSYPIGVPPAAAGPVPSLSLSYDSGSIDGRTANTNNQGSMVGEGFDLTSSYIERKYGACDDDGQDDKFDQCWKYENASLVLNGKATELVKDDAKGIWRLKNDDASQVTHETGADNGDDGDTIVDGKGDGKGEYWKVVTGDGTVYTFGLNKLPGAGAERTNSVWTVPVFGDDSGEPGYSSGTGFSGRAKTQAWRWNLDLAMDVHGNASTYWYKAETNNYAKNGDKTELAAYTRGGYLEEIKYGQRSDTLFTGTPSGKVAFTHKERCTAADCSSLTEDTADNWPDVPFDSICSASETDCLATGPAFFTRKMLTGVDTSVWSTAREPDDYKPVDSYRLTQGFRDGADIGNPSDKSLVLETLQRTGKNGDPIAVPPVEFDYHMRPNRVDSDGDNILPFSRPRINEIISETGAVTTVTLSGPECVRGSRMPAAEDDNSLSCYPVYWAINGGDPALDWFHKYNVTSVSTSDPAGQNEAVENFYTYEGPGWHYNDDPFTPEDQRTWSSWRGYRTVTTTTGGAEVTQSKTVRRFMQGLSGDKRLGGTNGPLVVVPGIDVAGLDVADTDDHDQLAGFLRQEITYNDDKPVSVTVNDAWSKQTASQQKSYAHTKAYFVRSARTYGYTYLPVSNTWRSGHTTYTFDDTYGMVTQTDASGDAAKTGDETCTRTWYARNAAKGLTTLVSRTRVVGSACLNATGALITDDRLNLPATSTTRGDVLSDTAVVYDTPDATGWSASQTPTLGLSTWTGRAKAYPAAVGTSERTPALSGGWQRLTRTTYDGGTAKLGRPLTISDAGGNVTTMQYFPAAAGPLTSTVVTAPKLASNGQAHKAYTYVDPARGSVTSTLDANLKKTENTYDALGRITATWEPNRSKSGNDSPSVKYGYNFARGSQPWTSVATLKADGTSYLTSYAVTDALLRPLQTQTASPLGGRILTDTRYDSRGLAYETYADIYDDTTDPNGTYARASYAHTPVLTQTAYDGAARPTTNTLNVFGVKKLQTTTSYTGDSTATTAVENGNATRTITDALGRTTETRTYAGATHDDSDYGATAGTAYTSVKYDYTRDGKPSQVTGPDSAKWTYAYDLFGRQTGTTDPDKGAATTEYTDSDQVDLTKDADNGTLLYGYDELGRKTDLWQTSRTDANKLSRWTYDTLLKGKPDASIRYVGGTTGKAYTKQVAAYDTLGRATSTSLTIPSDDPLVTSGAVTATATLGTDYRLDGTVNVTQEPAAAGLPSEYVQPTYNSVGLTTGLSGISGYLLGVSYSAIGQVEQLTLGTGGAGAKNAYINSRYEAGTGRLTKSSVTDETHPYMLQDLNFTQDLAGNVTRILDGTTLGGTTKPDYQCFTYDGYRRLTEAWTPKTADCVTTGRTTANVDGAAPYWTSYTYNSAGQRKTETNHATTGNTTTTYEYGTAAGQPHPLARTTGARAATYAYDKSGNTTSRPGTQAAQTLGWNAEGKLASTTEPAAGSKPALNTSYLYDADGELLIRRATGDGDTVLYLGATEVRLTVKGSTKTVSGTRYYTAAGQAIAVRTATVGTAGTKLSFLAGDHHGTTSLVIDAATQAVTKRYTAPFGAPRGTKPTTWPDDKAFLGKPADTSTGLTHVGAREYDPGIGQFISVDPILALDQHQSLNGYSYANNTPVTSSDPTGLMDPGGTQCGYVSACKGDGPTWQEGHGPSTGGGGGKIGGGGGNGGGTSYSSAGDWEIEGSNNADLDGDGYINVYPGVVISADWRPEDSAAFIEELYDQLDDNCSGHDLACVADISDPNNRYEVAFSARSACVVTGCSEGNRFWNNVVFAGMSAMFAQGPGGGIRGLPTRQGGKPSSSGCTQCFLAGTDVLMADGTTKDIEDVELGDTVQATDPETGESGPREVTRLIVTEDDKHFNTLSISTDNGIEQLTATYEHPFWSPSEKRWLGAAELKPGMTLLTDDGDTVIVTANRAFTKHARTYNLTVDDLHTYYVLAGDTPVLVHNSSCPVPISKGRWDHIWDRHVVRGGEFPNKSKFLTTSKAKIQKMINRALDGQTGDGAYYYEFPNPIGRNGAGDDQYYIRVVVRDRKLITAFPSEGPE
ncbi:polymorphic toxin-type HINT domain-containing protein [Streptomyces sp. NPDC058220]|uniref:polymorphic toxin-type HINT domain-containing protein n=1 Tax=Streptomyces sp. NPDC058220 TaxID=3346387 RepID=UPI0036E18C9C